MPRPRPVAAQSTAALVVALLAILAVQFFRNPTRNADHAPPTPPPSITDTHSEPPPTARPDIGFRSRQAVDEHFRKHAREFGPDLTPDDYLRRAQALRDAPAGGPILEARRPDGVTTRFDRRTGDFLAFNPDRTLRTFFRPTTGESYFTRQAQRPED
jgi:hypothetical protein